MGGSFSSVGGKARQNLAAIDAATGIANDWNPGANGIVYELAEHDSLIYAVGSFTSAGGQTRKRAASFDPISGAITSWDPNVDYGNVGYADVLAIKFHNDTAYLAGDFGSVGGQIRPFLAAVDLDTTGTLTAWNPNPNDVVYDVAVSGNRIFAGGAFTTISGQPRNYIAALDANSGIATAWDPGANDLIRRFAISDTTLYAVGRFTSIGGQTRNRIAGLELSTGIPYSWNPDANEFVRIVSKAGSKVFVGGEYTAIGRLPRSRIAAVDDGSGEALPWNPAPNDIVRYVVSNGTSLYMGGPFTTLGGQSHPYFAQFDESPDDSYEPNQTWQDALNSNAIIRPGDTVSNLASFDEDWYRIDIAPTDSIRVRVSFDHLLGNLNAQLYDARSWDFAGSPYRIAESYAPNHPWIWDAANNGPAPDWDQLPWGSGTEDEECLTYTNTSGGSTVYLRVYGEGDAQNSNYTVSVESLGAEDMAEPNNSMANAFPIGLGTKYEGLIGRDNDFYRVETHGAAALRIRVSCYALFGSMYYEIYGDDPVWPLADGRMYTPNLYEAEHIVCVGGRDHVYIRVYPAVHAPNVYNLAVDSLSDCPPAAPVATIEQLSPDDDRTAEALFERMLSESPIATPTATVTAETDDSYESNNSWEQARDANKPIHAGETISGLRLYNEDWYKIELGPVDRLRVRVNFTNANGDINLQLYDARAVEGDGGIVRVGESYAPVHPWVWDTANHGDKPDWITFPWGPQNADGEWITYLNTTGASVLYLRVYGEQSATNPLYSLAVDALNPEDGFEPNNTHAQAKVAALGQTYENLVGKDDDFFRVSIPSGVHQIKVRVACYALFGTMYFEVYGTDPSSPLPGGKMYTPNLYEAEQTLCVDGLTEVVVRVYPAVHAPNVYNLAVEQVAGTCP